MSNSFQNKLLSHEVPPPGGTWEKIAARLDEQEHLSFPSRLYHFEQSPPPAIWAGISSHLEPASIEKASPFYIRYRRPLKYTGAVAAIFVLVILGSLLISKKTVSEIPSSTMAGETIQNTPGPITSPPQTQENENRKPRYAQAEAVTAALRHAKNTKEQIDAEAFSPSFASVDHFIPRVAERNAAITYSLPADQYMIYSDGEGHVMRLPKRLYDAVACPSDPANCRQKLKALQQKIASSVVASDLSGMLEMLNGLPENQ